MNSYPRVLSIAGSDSGGGAGIQADLKAISACGGYGMTAITAITVQNTIGVQEVMGLPISIIKQQIKAVMDDIGADAIKVGMLHNAEVIGAVADMLEEYKFVPVVLDPVMVATSGDILLQEDALEHLCERLIPKVKLLTPNVPEAELLLHKKISNQEALRTAAIELAQTFQIAILLKGGHMEGTQIMDIFYDPSTEEVSQFVSPRIDTPNTHGTGCTLSSAIATFLARDYDLESAVEQGIQYVHGAIEAGSYYETGSGNGPVHHFYPFWDY